jgi:HEAT repeat protein
MRSGVIRWCGAAALVMGLASSGTRAVAQELAEEPAAFLAALDVDDEAPADRESEVYDLGTEALDEERWDEAVRAFDEAVRMAGKKADGALYWKAYALRKAGKTPEALAALGELRRKAPQSRWVKEADALEQEIRQASGQRPAPEAAADEELKLIAINSLMHTDSARALPMLEGILASNRSPKLRDRALFVLSQSGDAQARAKVADIARGKSHPDLQRRAIRYLGMFGGGENGQALAEIYSGSTDSAVKKAVLQAYLMSGDRERVLALARGEKSPDLRRDAIRQLGAMGGQDELWQLYRSETALEVKKEILHGMAIGGGTERLMEIARSESQPELRRAAIRGLGIGGGGKSTPTLLSIYQSDKDPDVREGVIEALFIQGNAQALVQLARSEKDPRMRRELVQKLSVMGSKEATDFLMEILDK